MCAYMAKSNQHQNLIAMDTNDNNGKKWVMPILPQKVEYFYYVKSEEANSIRSLKKKKKNGCLCLKFNELCVPSNQSIQTQAVECRPTLGDFKVFKKILQKLYLFI